MAANGKHSETPLVLALSSRGPWLGDGLCCPATSRLTMASSEPLADSCRLMDSSAGLCNPVPTARGSPIYSARLSRRAISWTPADRTVARGYRFTVHTGLRRLRIGSASAVPRDPVSARRVTRLFEFALLRPDKLLALHRPGRLHPSFHLLSRLSETSNMTTRADSQIPRPVFRRQDAQPYGLRT